MSVLAAYRLRFRTPLHIGERGVGLEETRTHVPADTLFGAICVLWRELFGVDSLTTDLLAPMQDAATAPFFLSSAFPIAEDLRLFPAPIRRLPNISVEETDGEGTEWKALKKIRFLTEERFRSLIGGESVRFDKTHLLHRGEIWATPEEYERLRKWTDDGTGEIVLWRKGVMPRVTLDRITNASQLWHFGELFFSEGVGLWFAVALSEQRDPSFDARFEACLRALGDAGLGGDRNAGRGIFEMDRLPHVPIPSASQAPFFLTLSPLCPKDENELNVLLSQGAEYELLPRRGWITSPEASHLRRKTVHMFAEGSVLGGNGSPPPGRLVNVKPDICPHDVWRYGYAFPVGVHIQ